jgi:hypothetical protein
MRKQITDIKTHYQTTFTCWTAYNEEVCHFEEENHLETHWTPASSGYRDALVVVGQHKYRKALDHLEHLCVQHLLELTKLSMSSVGA